MPLNLFPCLPEYQIEFGQTIVLPIVKPSSFGILGIDWDIITLAGYIWNGKLVYKADAASLL